MYRKLSTILLAAMLVLTAFAPAAVGAQETTESTTDLAVSLVQDPATGSATVTVTNGSDPVAGATVNVTSSVTYAGEGEYTTGADGTVGLPNPTQTSELDVEVTSNGVTVVETFTIVPVEDSIGVRIAQNVDGDVLVTVTQYGEALEGAEVDVSSTVAYAGNGTYTTDANGTVPLPEPEQSTEVTAAVSSGDLEEFGTATIEPTAEFEVALATAADGTATVTVTRDDVAVDNATVTVTSDAPYAGNGKYTTDANGTVSLPEPARSTEVSVTAAEGDDEATTVKQLSPVDTGLVVEVTQESDGSATVAVTDDGTAVDNATVTVTSDAPYAGNGTYETGADGTVGLPSPDRNLTVSVVAINGSEEATTTADLELIENGGFANFGLWISSYVDRLKQDGYFGKEFGQKVSEFATENNPGADNRPDHAGPKDERGAASAEGDDERGPPEHAKNENAGEDRDGDEDETEGESADDESEDVDSDDTDCDVKAGEESCADDSEDTEEESDEDDSPGNSGDRGNGGGNNGNGNGRGK
jgi:hypothetical protein